MPITIPKPDLLQPDRVRITLRFEAFSEDGEVATVSDAAGVCADIPLSSLLWEQHRDLIAGDTATCDMLREVWAESGLVVDGEAEEQALPEQTLSVTAAEIDSPPPDDAPEPQDSTPPAEAVTEPEEPAQDSAPVPHVHNLHRRGMDVIEVSLPLTHDERLELAQEMADALAERDRLESEFNIIKKDYKTRIDMQVSVAAQAGETYRAGERTQDVSCDMFEDRTMAQIVWIDSASGAEVKRRAMTFEERHLKLPGMDIHVTESSSKKGRKKKAEDTPPALAPDARTCLNCGHRDTTTDAMPEPCHTCSQIESGESDNWAPVHECATCTHKTTRVNMPPCAGCNLNADATHRGKKDAWEWAQQPEQALPDGEPTHTGEGDTLPDMPCADDDPDNQHTPDELDDIPTDCIPQDDDAMPTLPPIGDGHGAGRSGPVVRQ